MEEKLEQPPTVQPTQRTETGLEFPIPMRGQILDAIRKLIQSVKKRPS